jgi:hypothetical protein
VRFDVLTKKCGIRYQPIDHTFVTGSTLAPFTFGRTRYR